MPKIPADAWVVVGDGEKALFMRNDGDEAFPNLTVIRELEQSSPPTREQGSERPGRQHDATGPHKSAYEETDFHRLDKERFASELAWHLYKAAHRNAFRHLIVVAPPRILGELRKGLHKEVESRVVFELAKELTNMPVYEIEKVITDA
jgi:protein required for attachment to host cells